MRDADFAIIGSGIVGLNAAIQLKGMYPTARVLLLERAAIPQGASTKNAGFACFGSPTELLDDLKNHKPNEVWELVAQRWEGLQRLREKVGDTNLNYQHRGGHELFRMEDQKSFENCLEKLSVFNRVFKDITGKENVLQVKDDKIESFGFKGIAHLIENSVEGQLHPGKMVQTLQRLAQSVGVEILYGVEVEDIESSEKFVRLRCKNGWQFKAQKALVTTNGFAKRLFPQIPLTPARNQVLVTAPIAYLPFQGCFHYDRGYYYFRNIGHRILVGGGRNLDLQTEATDEFGNTSNIQDALLNLLETVVFPRQKVDVEYWWSGILGVGEQKTPIIGMIDERIGVAVRLGGMGIALGTLVGESAAEMLAIG